MINPTELRGGAKLELEGDVFEVISAQHVKSAQRRAVMRVKLKALRTGKIMERTFLTSERLEEAKLEERPMQYQYKSGDEFAFMDLEHYEQVMLSTATVGDAAKWMKENEAVETLWYKGECIGLEIPMFVILEVTQSDPGLKGDTASGATKPATLETGAVIQVPLFINEGDKLKIDTRTGIYVERA